MRNWTDSQKQAFSSLDGSILVSAAAGSGKTAVLVERVVQRITKDNPSNIENLLIVTFTKAAAEEMKDRLSKTITKMLSENPGDSNLRRQKIYLSDAQICTIDSFCNKLVKDNYAHAGISPDFTMMSDSENYLMQREVLDDLLEEIYGMEDEGILKLLDVFTNGKNDEDLISFILSIYEYAMADSNPEHWIEEVFSQFVNPGEPQDSKWGRYTYEKILDTYTYIYESCLRIINDCGDDNPLRTAIENDLSPVISSIKALMDEIENIGEWDNVRYLLSSVADSFPRFPRIEKDELGIEIKARRDLVKKYVNDSQDLMMCSAEEYREDMNYLESMMKAVQKLVTEFMSRLKDRKDEEASYYFSDILHFSLRLLVDFDEDNNPQPTPLAKEISESYDEILIDEFQDTNRAQVCLFDAISRKSGNQFMVGDVKQSIYAFRRAMPDIFVGLTKKYEVFDGGNYPAKIALDKNFRSRKGIVDCINFIFNRIMTPEIGDVDYEKNEQLVFGAKYDEEDADDCVELHLLEKDRHNSSNIENESVYIGYLIHKIIESGISVGAGDDKHQVCYNDICVLMRNVKNKASKMASVLTSMDIPVYFEKKDGFFDDSEIVTAISLLKIIDNPVQDVPLLSVLLSPVCPFSEEDLSLLRSEDREASVYQLLKDNAENDKRIMSFLSMLKRFRTLSVSLRVSELIRRVYEESGLDCLVEAMPNGNRRAMNLRKLVDLADSLEKNGNLGLSSFIRYIDKLRDNASDLSPANELSKDDDVVRIMTIHKSKGLEFPIVILAQLDDNFSYGGSSARILVNRDLGAGAVRHDDRLNANLKTQSYTAVQLKNDEEEKNEQMRVLYVAMTRAREKLFLVGSISNPEKTLLDIYYSIHTGTDKRHVALRNSNSYLKWILGALTYHPGYIIEGINENMPSRMTVDTESSFKMISASVEELETQTAGEPPVSEADPELVDCIRKKVEYRYPYEDLSTLPIKYSASAMDRRVNNEFFASEIPSFESASSISAAQKGTLIHRFMELCDLDAAAASVTEESERLKNAGFFNENEAKVIEAKKVESFFKSGIYERIKKSDKYLREQEFTMKVRLGEISSEYLYANENVILQGVMDGLIVNGDKGEVIDYKTDRVKDEAELVERYKGQMSIYRMAAKKCFNLKDVSVTIYSFWLGKEISVKF